MTVAATKPDVVVSVGDFRPPGRPPVATDHASDPGAESTATAAAEGDELGEDFATHAV